MTEHRPEIVVASSSREQTLQVWDVQSSTFLTAFKGNESGRNALAVLGQDYFIAAQAGKTQAIHAWAWHKNQVHLRSFTAEGIVSLASTRDGTYIAAGGEKGNIYVWESGTGKLLRSFPAHYKSVTVLGFTDDSAVLVSGGEDCVVTAWLMMALLDASSQHNPASGCPQPLHTWSGHNLAVTGLFVGTGTPSSVVFSVSGDRSCKIWSLVQGHLLRSMPLPLDPVCVVADPWEHSVFIGTRSGKILEASLLERRQTGGAASRAPGDALSEAGFHSLDGHSGAVNCLAIGTTGYNLVSGSEDGTILVWDVQSLQLLHIIQANAPVSGLLVLKRPLHMASTRNGESGKKGPQRAQALAALKKYIDASEPWQGPPVIIDGTQLYAGVVVESGLLEGSAGVPDSQISTQAEFEKLASERDALQAQLQGAAETIAELRAVNSKLHAFVVESNLAE